MTTLTCFFLISLIQLIRGDNWIEDLFAGFSYEYPNPAKPTWPEASKWNADNMPYVAAIYLNQTRLCTATIVDVEMLVTDSICCDFKLKGNFTLRVGSSDDRYGEVIPISFRTYYVGFVYHMCVWRVDTPFVWTKNVQKADLPTQRLPDYAPGFLYAWGSDPGSHLLKQFRVNTIDLATCRKRTKIDARFVCMCLEKTVCGIESGAPFIVSGILYGFAALNLDCDPSKADQPLVLTAMDGINRQLVSNTIRDWSKINRTL